MSIREQSPVRRAVRTALSRRGPVVLAVSGGLDSMTLLEAASATVGRKRLSVATFDHGTGDAATTASRFVVARCAELGIRCVSGRATEPLASEAELRATRWEFLRRVAVERGAVVATAHTASDQVETVVMRVLRDAGARGLAGLYARGDVIRPLIQFRRAELEDYCAVHGVSWVDDPSNTSRQFFRNRIRHDLLAAMRRVRPSIDAELLAVSRSAAQWREDVEAYVDEMLDVRLVSNGALDVGTAYLAEHSLYELAVLWPAVAARAGAVLDRSGIRRLAEFTKRGGVGSRIQLSGGWEVTRARNALHLRKSRTQPLESLSLDRDGAKWGEWTFRPAKEPSGDDPWSACLPDDAPLSVRSWRAGDTMSVRAGAPARNVKRFLSRAGVTGHDRASWPVVLSGDQIVWIPGVRRSDAATARSGRPEWGLPFVCEHYRR